VSFILEALEQAEKEKRLKKAPEFGSLYRTKGRPKRRPWLLVWIGGALVLNALVLAFIFGPSRHQGRVGTDLDDQETELLPSSPGAEPAERGAPLRENATKAHRPSESASLEPEQTVAASAPSVQPADPEVTRSPKGKDEGRPAVFEAEKGADAPKSIPLLEELSPSIRERLPKMVIRGHIYTDDPSRCYVFINSRGYRVGDRIEDDGPIVETITPEGVIIDYGEGKARILIQQ
jgi:hypothetical protein